MKDTSILTSHNVILQLASNTLMWRILAYVIDLVIMSALIFSIIYFFGKFNIDLESEQYDLLGMVLFLPFAFYTLISEFLMHGKTIGKLICKLKVIKINGYHCGYTEYLMRWLFRLVEIYPFLFCAMYLSGELAGVAIMLTGIPAFISILITQNNQRLGDLVAGTTVVRQVQRTSLSSTIFKEVSTAYVPVYAQVVKLSDNDMRIIQETYKIAKSQNDYKTITKLKAKIQEVIQVETHLTDIEFIDSVILDFNHYTQKM